jgi:hypothetical protein
MYVVVILHVKAARMTHRSLKRFSNKGTIDRTSNGEKRVHSLGKCLESQLVSISVITSLKRPFLKFFVDQRILDTGGNCKILREVVELYYNLQ